jgi:hypothetical protein
MSLTNDQLLDRIVALEEAIDTLVTTLNNLPTRKDMKNLVALFNKELIDLRTRVEVLEVAVQALQS